MWVCLRKYDLKRFINAQKNNWDEAYAEISAGRKESHWIWYIFPQLKGLGQSYTSENYGIGSMDEAVAYLHNDYLRNNLITITKALLACEKKDITEIVGYPDDLKIRSCMTLFYYAAEKLIFTYSMNDYEDDRDLFKAIIDKYYSGQFDERTEEMLR